MPRIEFASDCDRRAALEILLDSFCECSACSDLVSHDNSQYIDEESYCENCASDANYCDGCNESTFADTTYVDGDAYCDCCRDNECYCDDNGEWHYGDAPEEDEEDEEDEEQNLNVGLARYHSDPIRSRWRVPSGECIGVEIETYCTSRDALSNSLRTEFACACERDGSLDCDNGIEIITPPTEVDKLVPLLENVARKMKETKCNSWKQSTHEYGVHVNLDCRQWSSDRRAKFCACFGPANKFWMISYAARECGYATFHANNENEIQTGKFSAAGVKSGGRLEVRIFKSSRRLETLLAYVSLCQDIARFTLCDEFNPIELQNWIVSQGSVETVNHMRKRKVVG